MSDIGETFAAMREVSQEKKRNNLVSSIQILKSNGIDFTQLSDHHFRIGDYDFWPSTGKFRNRITSKAGRGVFKLVKILNLSRDGSESKEL
jgi:hypothetical protein